MGKAISIVTSHFQVLIKSARGDHKGVRDEGGFLATGIIMSFLIFVISIILAIAGYNILKFLLTFAVFAAYLQLFHPLPGKKFKCTGMWFMKFWTNVGLNIFYVLIHIMSMIS